LSHIEVVNGHAIHNNLKRALQTLSELLSAENIDSEQLLQIERMHYVLNILQSTFAKADPMMIAVGSLDSVNVYVEAIFSYMSNFQQTMNAGQITNSISNIDAICQNIRNLYVPSNVSEIEAIREATVSFRQSLAQHLRHSSKETEEKSSLVQKLGEEAEELKRRIDAEKTRIDTITANYQSQFSESEAIRQREYSNSLAERKADYDTELEKYREDFSKFELTIEQDLNAQLVNSKMILGKLEQHQEKAKRILGTLSVDGHAAGYKIEADNARNSKINWQRLTVALFIGLIISAIWNAFFHQAQFTWAIFASKWSVTLAIGAAVTYCAKQASKLDRVERENRNMELQMATIDPYLEIFNETERKEIKKVLVDRIFTGVRDSKDDDKGTVGLPVSDFSKIIESLGKVINRS
jgi:hypothetical protein